LNGSTVARLAYLKNEVWTPFGSVVYFRSHDVRIRLKTIPLWAIANDQWTLGRFIEGFKVEEAQYLSGDVIVKDGEEIIKIGRIETASRPDGKVDWYLLNLSALPAAKVLAAMKNADLDKKHIWLDVILEENK